MEGAGVHLPYYCNVDEGYNHCWHFYKTRSQLTRFFFKAKEKEREVWEKTRGRPRRKIKRRRQTGQQVDRDRVSGTKDEQREWKKESRWYRQRNEQVIEVNWEWEQERKKRRGDLREIKHGLSATEVRRQTSMLWQPAGTFPADRAVSQSVLRSCTAPHGDVWRRQDGIA